MLYGTIRSVLNICYVYAIIKNQSKMSKNTIKRLPNELKFAIAKSIDDKTWAFNLTCNKR